MLKRLTRDYIVIASGIGIIIISLGADYFGFGGDLRIGLKQILGSLFGFFLVLVGVDYYFWKKFTRRLNQERLRMYTGWVLSLVGITILLIIILLPRLPYLTTIITVAGLGLLFIGLVLRFFISLKYGFRYISTLGNKILITHIGVIRTIFGGMLLGSIITLALFSDVFRGSLVTFIVFLMIGLGPTILFLSSYRRADMILAISPAFGFCLVHLIGSWLVRLNLPVSKWAWLFTLIGIVFSLITCLKIYFKNSKVTGKINWKGSGTVLCGFGFVLLMGIIPVLIGGLKFSVFRGNPDDANNYLAMAGILDRIPMSMIRTDNFQWLFEQNPVFPWAAAIITGSRWASSMLLDYSAILADIPIYRFDLAFSALCYVLLFGPALLLAKSINLKPVSSFLLAAAVALGFYAQLVMDIRALSEVTSFPILVLLVLLISLIGEDTAILSWKLPGNWKAYLLFSLCLAALVLAYMEILSIFLFSIFLFIIYTLIRQWCSFWKMVWIMISSIIGLGVGFLTTPILLIGFINLNTNLKVQTLPWIKAFFQWLYHDSLAGPFGLSPYHNSVFTQLLMTFFGCILLVALILSIINHLIFVKKPNYGALLSIFLALTGIGVFSLFFLLGKNWQAGKAFTYVYPFLMVSLALIRSPLPEIQFIKLKKLLPVVQKILNGVVFTWLISQALLGFYRIGVARWGFEYPFYMAAGNNPVAYEQKYKWDLEPIRKIINSTERPLVWISGNIYINEYLSINFDPSVRLMPVSMISGWIPLYDSVKPTSEWPDYLLIQKYLLSIQRDGSLKEHVVYLDKNDNGFALIKVPQAPLRQLWLVGIQGADGRNLVSFDAMGRPGFEEIYQNSPIGLQFLSDGDAEAIVNSEILILNNIGESGKDARIDCSMPAGDPCEVYRIGNNIEMRFNAHEGFNYLLVESDQPVSFWLQNTTMQTNKGIKPNAN